jgi:PPM family protein phosphatase
MKKFLHKIFGVSDTSGYQHAAGETDPGKCRENNEDAFLVLADRDIFVVADGMGGHNAGEVAATLATQFIDSFFTVELVEQFRHDPPNVRVQMENAFVQVSKEIYKQSHTDPDMEGMGCTLVIAFVNGSTLHTCHVGDARCYVASSSAIEQIGSDHSQVWELVRLNKLTPEQARMHDMKNILTQAIGQRSPLAPEYHLYDLKSGDKVLLCSDGLWDMLTDDEIQGVLMRKESPRAACRELIRQANEAGGHDNITVVVVDPCIITKETRL